MKPQTADTYLNRQNQIKRQQQKNDLFSLKNLQSSNNKNEDTFTYNEKNMKIFDKQYFKVNRHNPAKQISKIRYTSDQNRNNIQQPFQNQHNNTKFIKIPQRYEKKLKNQLQNLDLSLNKSDHEEFQDSKMNINKFGQDNNKSNSNKYHIKSLRSTSYGNKNNFLPPKPRPYTSKDRSVSQFSKARQKLINNSNCMSQKESKSIDMELDQQKNLYQNNFFVEPAQSQYISVNQSDQNQKIKVISQNDVNQFYQQKINQNKNNQLKIQIPSSNNNSGCNSTKNNTNATNSVQHTSKNFQALHNSYFSKQASKQIQNFQSMLVNNQNNNHNQQMQHDSEFYQNIFDSQNNSTKNKNQIQMQFQNKQYYQLNEGIQEISENKSSSNNNMSKQSVMQNLQEIEQIQQNLKDEEKDSQLGFILLRKTQKFIEGSQSNSNQNNNQVFSNQNSDFLNELLDLKQQINENKDIKKSFNSQKSLSIMNNQKSLNIQQNQVNKPVQFSNISTTKGINNKKRALSYNAEKSKLKKQGIGLEDNKGLSKPNEKQQQLQYQQFEDNQNKENDKNQINSQKNHTQQYNVKFQKATLQTIEQEDSCFNTGIKSPNQLKILSNSNKAKNSTSKYKNTLKINQKFQYDSPFFQTPKSNYYNNNKNNSSNKNSKSQAKNQNYQYSPQCEPNSFIKNFSTISDFNTNSNIDEVSQLPSWLKQRRDFKLMAKQNKIYYFKDCDVHQVALKEQFQRDNNDIQKLGNYIKRIGFFAQMPDVMIEYISGKIKMKSYKDGQLICKKGDKGNCMYIIFRGKVNVLSQGKKILATYEQQEMLGRMSLENNAPRNADLQAEGNVDIFEIDGSDYQFCLRNVLKNEKDNILGFVKQIPFFKQNFSNEWIENLLTECKLKYLAVKDPLYQKNEIADGLYIVKKGKLSSSESVTIKQLNQWPAFNPIKRQLEKERRRIDRIVNYKIQYEEQDFLGYYEILISHQDQTRYETIKAEQDSIVIFIPKQQFLINISEYQSQLFTKYYINNWYQTTEQKQQNFLNAYTSIKDEKQLLDQVIQQHYNRKQGVKNANIGLLGQLVDNRIKQKQIKFKEKMPQSFKKQPQIIYNGIEKIKD